MHLLLKSIAIGYWLALMSYIQLVNAQAGTGFYFPEVKRYSEANTCNEKLMLPLTSLIFPNNITWGYMCGLNYFDSCRAEFSSKCSMTSCSKSINDYMRWVDAMSLSGSKYTCGLGMQQVKDALMNGGYLCITSTGREIFREVIALDNYVWSATGPINCTEMESFINSIYAALESCNTPGMYNNIDGYFKAIIKSSPCAEQINTGAAHHFASSFVVIALASIFSIIF